MQRPVVAAVILSALVVTVDAQQPFDMLRAGPSTAEGQQRPAARADWPCGGRVDPSYFHLAEGTGGQLLLLAPSEIADSATWLVSH